MGRRNWRRWSVLALALVAAMAIGARAAEFGVKEKRWLRQCVEAIASGSDVVGGSAELALTAMGVEAIPHLVPLTTKLKDQAAFDRLGRALAGMESSEAADGLEDCRKAWPKTQTDALSRLLKQLRAGVIKPARPGSASGSAPAADPVPDSPAGVAEQVRTLLDPFRNASSYSSNDPGVASIVRLGRPALGALVEEIRRAPTHGMLVTAATDALAELVTDADVGILRELVLEGYDAAAKGLGKLASKAALEALIDIVDRGMLGHGVLRALDRHRSSPKVQSALLTWLEKHGERGEFVVGQAAEFLADARVARAAPLIERLVDARQDASVRWQLAAAGADLGVKRGIEALIEVLEGQGAERSSHSLYPRYQAGKRLNQIAGRTLFIGSYQGREPEGNWNEASRGFRDWWDENGDRLKWDDTTWKWRLP